MDVICRYDYEFHDNNYAYPAYDSHNYNYSWLAPCQRRFIFIDNNEARIQHVLSVRVSREGFILTRKRANCECIAT